MGHILLVDDDAQVRKMLKITLEREGYSITEAGDGTQAVQVYDADGIDLVITDIVMPRRKASRRSWS